MTDGKSHQTITGVINDLKEISDPLIAAGIGLDTDQEFLLTLASNSSTVVYDNNTDNALRLGRRIIEVMRNTAALCEDEGIVIIYIGHNQVQGHSHALAGCLVKLS